MRISPNRTTHVAAAALLLLLCGAERPAHAAVRVCVAPQTSGIVAAATEAEAKRKALAAWSLKAKAFGEGYAAWTLAANRALKCAPAQAGKGGFVCFALGSPCTIRQAPPARPFGKSKPQDA
jgi:hypothetical protein